MKLNGYNNNRNITGELIREYRERLNLSRDKLSSKLSLMGITLYGNDIYRIETNKRTIKDYELIALCEILEIPMETLVNSL